MSDCEPHILGMYQRGFAPFRKALETYWQAYLNGEVPREAAIRKIPIETTPAKK